MGCLSGCTKAGVATACLVVLAWSGLKAVSQPDEPLIFTVLRITPEPAMAAFSRSLAALLELGTKGTDEDARIVDDVGCTGILVAQSREYERLMGDPPLFETPYDRLFIPRGLLARMVREGLPMIAERARAGVRRAPPNLGLGDRTAFVDEHLMEAIAGGTRQVLTLGAGLDTRAIRLDTGFPARGSAADDGTGESILWVEVDQAAVLGFKTRRLEAAGVAYPPKLVRGNYLQIDLVGAVLAAGLDPGKPIFVIWEGNTMYLPAHRARGVLRSLVDTFPKATVYYDYFVEPYARATPPEHMDFDHALVHRICGADWMWIGPWDQETALEENGLVEVERLNQVELMRRMRGAEKMAELRRVFGEAIETPRQGNYSFAVVRKAAAPAGV